MAARIVTVACPLASTLPFPWAVSVAIANPTQFFGMLRGCA